MIIEQNDLDLILENMKFYYKCIRNEEKYTFYGIVDDYSKFKYRHNKLLKDSTNYKDYFDFIINKLKETYSTLLKNNKNYKYVFDFRKELFDVMDKVIETIVKIFEENNINAFKDRYCCNMLNRSNTHFLVIPAYRYYKKNKPEKLKMIFNAFIINVLRDFILTNTSHLYFSELYNDDDFYKIFKEKCELLSPDDKFHDVFESNLRFIIHNILDRKKALDLVVYLI